MEFSANYICTHLGEEDAAQLNYGAVIPPIYATSLHVFDDMEGLLGFDPEQTGGKFIYGRVENPTVALLEQKIAALENADGALCFGSGMAAITSAILHCVKPGDHVVAVENAYGPARKFLDTQMKKFGVETSYIAGTSVEQFAQSMQTNTTLFYLESPTSMVMELQPLAEVAALAKANGIQTVIDNTWATPLYQQPLTLGITMSVHTISKYIGGHSDVIGGVLCGGKEVISQIQANERELYGGILGPFEGWLALRGLRTMPARLAQSARNAQAVAEFLEGHSRVGRVHYPGLASYTQYELAQRQLKGSSGLLSFELEGTAEESIQVANRLQLFRKGVSWGGFESLVCMPMYKYTEEEAHRRHGNRNLIRLYCGLEDQQELLRDVEQALEK